MSMDGERLANIVQAIVHRFGLCVLAGPDGIKNCLHILAGCYHQSARAGFIPPA